MAIKRPSKGVGKAVGKPLASAVQHVEVRTKHQMIAGQSYEGWLCKGAGCGLVMAILPPAANAKPVVGHSDDHLASLKCPHCGNEDLYRWNARGPHTFTPPGAPAGGAADAKP